MGHLMINGGWHKFSAENKNAIFFHSEDFDFKNIIKISFSIQIKYVVVKLINWIKGKIIS